MPDMFDDEWEEFNHIWVDPLRPARGVLTGLMLGLAFWAGVAEGVWRLLRR